MAQLTYSTTLTPGNAGDLGANSFNHDVRTYNVVTGSLIQAGLCVAKISGDENGAKLPASAADQLLGVAMRDLAQEDDPTVSTMTFPAKAVLPVVCKGPVWVKVEEDVTPDDAVYVRFQGEVEIFTITFDADIVTGNSIACTIDGTALSATAFTSDHLTTMQALATKIQALSTVTSATVGGGSNRVITVTAANEADDMSTNSSATVTGGASQAVATVASVSGPSSGTQEGIFRTDSDTGAGATAVALTKSRFLTNGSAGGVALLELNIP